MNEIRTSKEDLMKMCEMRIDGKTYQEIADEFNVSKQAIYTKLSKFFTLGSIASTESCAYPALAEFMNETRLTQQKLYSLLYDYEGSSKNANTVKLGRKLKGLSDFKTSEWLKLHEITKIPLEKLMVKKDG